MRDAGCCRHGLILVLSPLLRSSCRICGGTRHIDWMTFAFQFGRVGAGHFTLALSRRIPWCAASAGDTIRLCLRRFRIVARDRQILAGAGDCSARRSSISQCTPLHDRVQGNWPCFLYPALAVAAAGAMRRMDWSRLAQARAHLVATLRNPGRGRAARDLLYASLLRRTADRPQGPVRPSSRCRNFQ